MLVAIAPAYAATYPIAAGASVSTINSTIAAAAAAGGLSNLVQFAAGNYSVTSVITVPCPVYPLTIQGPVVAWSKTPGQQALLTGPVAGSAAVSISPCSTPITIQYLAWNGTEPSPDGGGFIYVSPGVSNLTIQYNYIHGNQGGVSSGGESDTLVWFDGYSVQGEAVDLGNTVAWNIFGHSNDGTTLNADCGTLSDLFTYQGGTYDAVGGYCASIGVYGQHTNFTIANNIIQYQEEGIKFYECGSTAATECYLTNVNVNYNDLSFVHRIFMETQASPAGAGHNFNDNDVHDPTNPAWGSWGFSEAEIGPMTNVNNVMIGNNPPYGSGGAGGGVLTSCPASYSSACIPGAFEWWGDPTTLITNMTEGYWFAGAAYGYEADATATNNYGCGYYIANYNTLIISEGYGATPPTESGNVTGPAACAAIASATPVISPTPSGSYSAPVTVTLTDAGVTNGGVGPQGNTTIYYTTDGSPPSTSSTPCNPTPGSTSCTISVAPGSTVKALGMWGAINQPGSYPAGYGFVPSAVVSATYGSGAATPLSSIALACVPTALSAGGSTSACTLTCTYGTSSDNCTTPDGQGNGGTYTSSNPVVASVSTLAVVTPLSAGNTNIGASVGVLNAIPVPISVTTSGAPPTIELGQTTENYNGVTDANYLVGTYSISPAYATTTGACHFTLPGPVTSGKSYSCILVAAPSSTTESATPLCYATYTTTSTTAPGLVSVTPSGCGTLAPSTAYWLHVITNDTGSPGLGFYACPGGCTGAAPTAFGTGSYPGYFALGTYGTYTGLPTTLTAGVDQVSIYIDLTDTAPVITSCYQGNSGSLSSMILGSSGITQSAYCAYSDGVVLLTGTTANSRGDSVTAWTSANTAVITVGAAGSGSPGLVTAAGFGTAASQCTVDGTVACTNWTWTVTNQAAAGVQMVGVKVSGMTVK